MKYRDLISLIESGENLYCDFKLHFSSTEKMAKELIAFANTVGGYILLGVDDRGRIVGVHSEKEETELIKKTAAEMCVPPVTIEIEYFEVSGKEIVVVSIPESDLKPHRLQDYLNELDINKATVFIRVNDKSVPASREMIRIMRSRFKKSALEKYSIGKEERIVFEYLDKNESITVKELKKLANISERRASRTLVKMVRADLVILHTKENGEEYFTYSGSNNFLNSKTAIP